MEASFSRRKLVTPAELKSLNVRSNLRGAGQMASHVGAILIAGYLHSLALGTGWVWVTGFVLGVLINFLYAAQHELSHATVFRAVSFVCICCGRLPCSNWGRVAARLCATLRSTVFLENLALPRC